MGPPLKPNGLRIRPFPIMRRFYNSLFLAAVIPFAVYAAAPVPDADNGGITLPIGFRALVVADNLVTTRRGDALRFIAVAPNGDVYAKTSRGGILALRDTDGDGRLDQKTEFGRGGGTGIALREGWLYHSSNSAVYRYKYRPGELVPQGEPELIVSGLPDEKGTHNAKSFTFDGDGRLLVEVGSPFNVYSEPDRQRGAKGMDATEFLKTHGGFWRFDSTKTNQTLADGFHFSTGHRHSLAVAWNPISRAFFMVQMGRDQLNTVDPEHYDALDNAERVAEEMHLLSEGVNLGWPYTYWDPHKRARMVAPEFGGDNVKRADPDKYDRPLIAFPAHWAPLQMAFYNGTQFPEKFRGGAFIAFHGSWNRAPQPQQGYNVTFVPFDTNGMPRGTHELFASGFPGREVFTSTAQARYRPGGVAVGPDGSLYISETDKGRIWRVLYTGETNAPTTIAALPAAVMAEAPASSNTRGRTLFTQVCAVCHMADGSGVPNMQPPLVGSGVVRGDPMLLVRATLKGAGAVLPPDRPKYGNTMPAFNGLTDDQIADTLSYVREVFGGGSSAVTPSQVKGARAD
jgi:glucose/arabinose dehydrogenase/cytochrome c5